jgi:putative ABC transport system substrate-binding protein
LAGVSFIRIKSIPIVSFAELGSLLSFGTEPLNNFGRATTYIDRILKGEKPSDMPVQAPTKYELVIKS